MEHGLGPVVASVGRFDLVFHAVTFAFDNDGLGVMEHAVQNRAADAGVVIKNFGPVFIRFVGRDNERAAFVALADDLEEQVGALVVRASQQHGRACQKLRPVDLNASAAAAHKGVEDAV